MNKGQDATVVNQGKAANEPSGGPDINEQEGGPKTFPLRYRCDSGCKADHVIQMPRKMRAVDMEVWAKQMMLRIGAHHGTSHPDCPARDGGAVVDVLFPIEGQDAEALAAMNWPTRDEIEKDPRRVDH